MTQLRNTTASTLQTSNSRTDQQIVDEIVQNFHVTDKRCCVTHVTDKVPRTGRFQEPFPAPLRRKHQAFIYNIPEGIQGKDWGIRSAFLGGKIACLQFIDDTTLFAHSKQEMVALFEQYSNFSFCRSYRINVNWGKCSVIVFREQDAEELAAEKARLEATIQRASAPRKQTKAKSLRLATEASEQSQPVYMTVQGQGIREKESFRILGVHLQRATAQLGLRPMPYLSKVAECTVPAAWVRDHMWLSRVKIPHHLSLFFSRQCNSK